MPLCHYGTITKPPVISKMYNVHITWRYSTNFLHQHNTWGHSTTYIKKTGGDILHIAYNSTARKDIPQTAYISTTRREIIQTAYINRTRGGFLQTVYISTTRGDILHTSCIHFASGECKGVNFVYDLSMLRLLALLSWLLRILSRKLVVGLCVLSRLQLCDNLLWMFFLENYFMSAS
jgi:hypothetical protein